MSTKGGDVSNISFTVCEGFVWRTQVEVAKEWQLEENEGMSTYVTFQDILYNNMANHFEDLWWEVDIGDGDEEETEEIVEEEQQNSDEEEAAGEEFKYWIYFWIDIFIKCQNVTLEFRPSLVYASVCNW